MSNVTSERVRVIMVRTRNTRSTSGGGGSGQGGGGKDTSPSFKPSSSGNKKGRKRQLTDSSGEAGPGQAAVLTPRPGTSTALALLGPGTSYHSVCSRNISNISVL